MLKPSYPTPEAERLVQARVQRGYPDAKSASEAFGWTYDTYIQHERGERGLRKAVAAKYAKAYGVTAAWLLTGEGRIDGSIINIMGRIGAGSQIDVGVEQVPEGGEPIETVMALPAGAIGFEVVGESMWPRYDPGDVIVVLKDGVPLPEIPDGDEAAVRTEDGLRYLKRLVRTETPGLFNLESHNAAPIRGARVDWAADVLLVIRKTKWHRITDVDRRRLARKAVARK
jgi:phage repressor protein C with HTH and peptisase S24 domain